MQRARILFVLTLVCLLKINNIDCSTRMTQPTGFRKVIINSNLSSNEYVTKKSSFACLRHCSLLQNCSVVSYDKDNGTCIGSSSVQDIADSGTGDDTIETYVKHGSESFYLVDLERKNFDQAKESCALRGGHLTYLSSQNDRLAIMSLMLTHLDPGVNVWIGAKRSSVDSMFYWFDGTAVNANLWYPGQPDNYLGKEDCTEVKSIYGYYLNNNECGSLFPSVCEFTF